MELVETVVAVAATLQYTGLGSASLAAGQSLKIETSPDGEDVLDVECLVGKAWVAEVTVVINEVDA